MKFKIAIAVVVAGLTLSACTSDNADQAVAQGGTFEFISPGGQTVIEYPEEERKPLQDFSGESLLEEGKTISLSDFKDEIVVLNSWGQWCAPCRSESDDLQRVQEELDKRGTGTMLGINVRDYNPDISRDFVKDNGITYPSIYDPPFKTAAALGGVPTSVVPTTIVLDKQHRPAAVLLKETTDKELLEIIDKLEQE
ncbi:TlpA family protein disulfide reductase [Corynebacterium phoceense]|uniref:TlpA disulfide reductase family protein n=1 Tax=Corynebacterium phoceense TaxID=1686286 RepID=UPI00211C71E6|nr:TlpA disulfide reductase family protein [Corynebacterium phoceense]MCQ9331541.1 TlpA family protein disulfide reductase [Corynebacterium phoceense]MCQ9341018.1 TlpA family protein disulfide reductase [Corynebacterium phoceense]MCQ9345100.1 TlpA family protein disulfide reductase [Corynebacterium phoceense]MCQ9348597.1 TlpA family protein disulfide reductase [Corynebacterium phoceense]